MRIKQLLTIIFLSSFLCTSAFAEGSKFDRGANSDEVTAQTRDDIWLSPASIPYITVTASETAESLHIDVKEENTSAISKGQVCAITGSSGTKIRVGLGDCDDAAKIRNIGLASDAITQNGDGTVIYKGIIEGVDTRDIAGGSDVNPGSEVWAAGDLLWVSTTAGGMTNVRPTSGRCIKAARTVKGNSNVDTLIIISHENAIWATAASGEDVVVRMGDSAGANKVSWRDYANNEVASLNSNGKFTAVTYETIWVPAISMTPRQTNGPSVGTYEYPTNDVNKDYLIFDAVTEQFADFEFPAPEDWNKGTVKVKFWWSSATGSTAGDTVEWQLVGQACSDGDAIDVAYSNAGQVISDILLANNGDDRQMSGTTPAITIGGTPALGDMLRFTASRNVGGTDDMVEKARLSGAWIQYKTGEPVVEW